MEVKPAQPEISDCEREPSLVEDESAATMLEWALLLAAIGIPSYVLIRIAMAALFGHYQLITTINSLPFP